MFFLIAVLTLFTGLIVVDAEAGTETEAERLAEMFSPILILTEDTQSDYGEDKDQGIIILKPEPVNIMGATSADSIWISSANQTGGDLFRGLPGDHEPPISLEVFENKIRCPNVDFSANKFAFLTPKCSSQIGLRVVNPDHFDYPGTTPEEWNDEYLGSGARAGENFPNTAYVHIYKRKISAYTDSVTVIQYKYFYPYNDWWNNHEGDWQGIDVVVSSSDPSTATFLGVEYRFHGAWLSYYKDPDSGFGLTSNFVFNPQSSVKLSPGPTRDGIVQYTHPVVYVGAGSHAAYPIGGNIETWNDINAVVPLAGEQDVSEAVEEVSPRLFVEFWEYMTHTGLVLSTQADGTYSDLWEDYDLVLLPEPDLNNTDNMGLADTLSWLGARIHWGTPDVGGAGDNKSPEKGPYNSNSDDWEVSKGWGELKFYEVGYTGPSWGLGLLADPFYHRELPYVNYHHWTIIGDETWSGTVNLLGDVVVFPGATLTIKPGTVVTFPSHRDRHQFKEGNNSLSEIFVYGTLESKGTSGNPVALGGTEGKIERWGGIHVLGSGSVDLGNYTSIRNTRPAKPAFVSTMLTSSPVSVAVEWEPTNDPVITYQTRISPDGTTWPEWSDWTEEYGAGNTYKYAETELREAKDYWLAVRAVNKTPFDPGDVYWGSDPLEVKVTTLGTEDAGEVVLEPTSPRVGERVRATLTDADGYIAGSVWTWERKPVAGTMWTTLTGSEDAAASSVYTPKATDLDQVLRVRVSYRDGHSTNTDTAESDPTAAVGSSNAHAPTIAGPDSVSYAENDTIAVSTYTATDADGHQIQWLPLAGDHASAFMLTGTDTDATRTLRFQADAAPNFETQSAYHVTLRVRDQPNEVIGQAENPTPARTTAFPVTVTVSNVKEPPGWPDVTIAVPDTTGHTTLHVRWTVANTGPPATYNLLWCVLADCSNTQTLRRYLTEPRFTLTDLKPATAYAVGVQAINDEGNGPWNDSATATTAAAANQPPVVAGDPAPPVLENATAVGPYTATDADANDTLAWQVLAGADASVFELVGTGAVRTLQFKAAPDFETPTDKDLDNVYAVSLAVSDGTATTTLAVAVTVSDVDEPPVFTEGPTDPSVNENATRVGRYAASDPDGDPITWSLAGPNATAFTLLPGSATNQRFLEFTTAPDFETKPTYQVTVRVSSSPDSGGFGEGEGDGVSGTNGVQTATREVTVTVSDVDEPPGVPTLTIAVPSTNGHTTLDVSWTVPSNTGPVLRDYTLATCSGHCKSFTDVNWQSQTLTTTNTTLTGLTPQTPYFARVRASNDEGDGAWSLVRSASTQAAPDSPPVFTEGPTEPHIDENKTRVGTYAASDPDGNPITWSLEGPNADVFTLLDGSATNQRFLEFTTAPDFETKSSYSVTVRISSSPDSDGFGEGEGAGEGESLAGEGEPPSDEGETPPEEGEPPASAKPVLTSLLSVAPDSVLAVVSVPNPFNPSTTLHVQLPTSGPVSLTLYNLSGQVVRTAWAGHYLDAGVHSWQWDGRDDQGRPVASGVYLYRVIAGDQTLVQKITLIR